MFESNTYSVANIFDVTLRVRWLSSPCISHASALSFRRSATIAASQPSSRLTCQCDQSPCSGTELPWLAWPTPMSRMQAGSARSLSAEMPEGNGTGFVWDDQVIYDDHSERSLSTQYMMP